MVCRGCYKREGEEEKKKDVKILLVPRSWY